MNRIILSLLCCLVATQVHSKQPFSAEHLVNLKRIGQVSLSPDEKYLAYTLRETDMDANKGRTDIWLIELENKQTRRFTSDPASEHDIQWAADSRGIYFLSARSGKTQIWYKSLSDDAAQQVSDLPVSITSFKLAPGGKRVAFTAALHANCKTLECSSQLDNDGKAKKASGRVYQQMFVRHWDSWENDKIGRLFSAELNAKNRLQKPRLISGDLNGHIPSKPFGGSEDYAFASDAQSIFVSVRIADRREPWSTNFDIYQIDLNRAAMVKNLTRDNLAWDAQPVVSADGKWLAYLAHRRPGFESDRFEVRLRNLATGEITNLTETWDRSFSSLAFAKDGKSLYLTGNHLGKKVLWQLDIGSGRHRQLSNEGYISGVSIGNNGIYFKKDDLDSPADIYQIDNAGKGLTRLTQVNQKALANIKFGQYEQFKFKGWNDETVHGYLVKPANYEEGKAYPLAFLIHGGPQGSFGDHFHYRWNPQTYAGQGFVAVMIDFHGSTGYGQKFTDSISGDWGGKPLIDLQKGLEYVKQTFSFVDTENACALGASYGGYMINWIAGKWPSQFKCLVNHDGVFDNRMMYYATEELWFVEWENGGPYFKVPQNHERFNPVNHVNNWKTPMLVIQGELDYRIPVTQGLATFTALQRRGIESKLLYFPDENHWVLKPANSLQWHHEVNAWLHRFLR